MTPLSIGIFTYPTLGLDTSPGPRHCRKRRGACKQIAEHDLDRVETTMEELVLCNVHQFRCKAVQQLHRLEISCSPYQTSRTDEAPFILGSDKSPTVELR
jgi:hypothetical protein